MNWFERHLNLTALGMGVGSIASFIVFPALSLGWSLIFPNDFLELSPAVIVFVSLVVFLWFVLSLIGYGWILYKKNRRPWYLLVFLPAFIAYCISLILGPGANIYQIFGHITYEVNPSYGLLLVMLFFLNWALGWLILGTLPDRSFTLWYTEDNSTKRRVNSPRSKLLRALFSYRKSIKYLLYTVLAGIVIVSTVSFFYIRYGDSTYHFSSPSTYSEIRKFLFQYPTSYTKPFFVTENDYIATIGQDYNDAFKYSVDAVCLEKIVLDQHNLNITVIFCNSSTTQSLLEKYGSSENVTLAITKYDFFRSKLSPRPNIEQITISGITAYKISSSIVYFEHDGNLWLIWEKSGYYKIPPTPDPDFTHLLETFKIYDE